MKSFLFGMMMFLIGDAMLGVEWADFETPSKTPIVALRGNDKFLYWLQAADPSGPINLTVFRRNPQGTIESFSIEPRTILGPTAIAPDGSLLYVQNNQYIMQIRGSGNPPRAVIAFTIPADLRTSISSSRKAMTVSPDGAVWVGAGQVGTPMLVRFFPGESPTLFQTDAIASNFPYMPTDLLAVSNEEVWYVTDSHLIRSGFAPRFQYAAPYRPNLLLASRNGKVYWGHNGRDVIPQIKEWPSRRSLFVGTSAMSDGTIARDGLLWFVSDGTIVNHNLEFTATRGSTGTPTDDGIVSGPSGNLYFADLQRPGWLRVLDTCDEVRIVTRLQDVSVASGGTASFEVAVSGKTPFSYQWYQGEANDRSRPVGTNSPRLTLTNVTSTGSFWVRITNECSTIDSNVAVVFVTACTAPTIQSHPSSTTVAHGGQAIISVRAVGTGVLQYQWYRGPRGNTTAPMPSTTAQLVLTNITSTATYWVRVTNSCGSVDSSEAVISVSAACPAMSGRNTFISYSDPVSGCAENSGECRSGVPVTFTAITFNYSFDCANHTFSWALPGGVTRTGRTMSHVFPGAGRFRVTLVVTNSQQTYTTFIDVPVSGSSNSGSRRRAITRPPGGGGSCVAPAITTQPVSQSVASASTATLSVAASGTAPFTYQWFSGTSGDTSSPVSGATAASFSTPAISSSRSFWARVSNFCGTVNSGTAMITLTSTCERPTITAQPASQSVDSGSAATLSVSATGTSSLSYQWYLGSSGDTTSPISGATSSTFRTPALTTNALFWVQVSNACGRADSDAASVTVASREPPRDGPVFTVSEVAGEQHGDPRVGALQFERTGGAGFVVLWRRYADGTSATPDFNHVLSRTYSSNGSVLRSAATVAGTSAHPVPGHFGVGKAAFGAGGSQAVPVTYSLHPAPTTCGGFFKILDESGAISRGENCVRFNATSRTSENSPVSSVDESVNTVFAWEDTAAFDANAPTDCKISLNWFSPVSGVYGSVVLIDYTGCHSADRRPATVDAWGDSQAFVVYRKGRTLLGRTISGDAPTSAPFEVAPAITTASEDSLPDPDVSCKPSGLCLVVWKSVRDTSGNSVVLGRRYQGSTALGDAFQVSQPPGVENGYWAASPRVTPLSNGGFVVAYTTGSSRVRAQIIEESGQLRGGPIEVYRWEFLRNGTWYCDVAAARDGSFMVVWDEDTGSLTKGRVLGRLYFGR